MTVTYQLEEKKEKLTYKNSKTSYLIHQRSIKTDCPAYSPFMTPFFDRSYSVRETFTEGEAVSDRMFLLIEGFGRSRSWQINYRDDSERMAIEKFEQDWSNLWNPQAILELD